jgi:hypothetical protein
MRNLNVVSAKHGNNKIRPNQRKTRILSVAKKHEWPVNAALLRHFGPTHAVILFAMFQLRHSIFNH